MTDAPWVRPPPDRSGYRHDATLAVVVAAGMTVSALLHAIGGFPSQPAPLWVSALCVAAITLPLIARRRYPATVALVVAVTFVVSQLLSVPELLICNIALFIALYSLGAWSASRRRANVVRALIVVGMFAWIAIAFTIRASDTSALGSLPGGATTSFVALGAIQVITNALYFGGAWYFGDRAWAAARERAVLAARTTELAREREITSQQAISLERVRIARELHDVVAHHVSVMGLQAGAARRVLAVDPGRAASALGAIEDSARSAVDELHRLLVTLRDDGSDPHTDDPPSVTGIEHLPALLRDTESAGVTARFTIIGSARAVPATVDATVYRVVQEALTNTLKHTGAGAVVDMRLRYLDDEIEIEVTDDGRGRGARPSGSGGLGLVGMGERVSAVGGRLESGPRSRGGFLVRANLPAANAARATAPDSGVDAASAPVRS
ncbi:MAG: hypothetical protein RI885_481 [Actinomycetota bacterium]|jgi:signal transduction histidine kinase